MVLASCGHSFDERAIRSWLTKQHKCPICECPSTPDQLIPNFSLRDAISEFKRTRSSSSRMPRFIRRLLLRCMQPGKRIPLVESLLALYGVAVLFQWPVAHTALPSMAVLASFPFTACYRAFSTLFTVADVLFFQLGVLLWHVLWLLGAFIWEALLKGLIVPVAFFLYYLISSPLLGLFGLLLPLYRIVSSPLSLVLELLPLSGTEDAVPLGFDTFWSWLTTRNATLELVTFIVIGGLTAVVLGLPTVRTLFCAWILREKTRWQRRLAWIGILTNRLASLLRRRNVYKPIVGGIVISTAAGYAAHLLFLLSAWYHSC